MNNNSFIEKAKDIIGKEGKQKYTSYLFNDDNYKEFYTEEKKFFKTIRTKHIEISPELAKQICVRKNINGILEKLVTYASSKGMMVETEESKTCQDYIVLCANIEMIYKSNIENIDIMKIIRDTDIIKNTLTKLFKTEDFTVEDIAEKSLEFLSKKIKTSMSIDYNTYITKIDDLDENEKNVVFSLKRTCIGINDRNKLLND